MGKTGCKTTQKSMKTSEEKLEKLFGERIKLNEPLSNHTTFRIGGPADIFFNAQTTDELVSIILESRKLKLPIFILGGGTNILVGDKGIRGLVVKNSTARIVTKGIKGSVKSGSATSSVYVEADSGVIFNRLVRFTIEEGLQGIEMHLGLPGTVGGAIYMNSKWTKPEGYIGDSVYQANILTAENKRKAVPKSYFQFAYDSSTIQKTKEIVLSVIFQFHSDIKEHLWEIATESMSHRRSTQPQGVKSAGCTFRNISKATAIALRLPEQTTSAGFLIDHAGLKGIIIGDAQISPVHANFIINRGKATAADVVQLIDRAKEQVKKQFGVELEEEIQRVGEF